MYLLPFEVFLVWDRFVDLSTTWYDLTPTGQSVKLYEKKNTFDFHILPEHRRIGGKIFPWRCISIKTAIIHEVGVDPFT